MGAAPRTLTLTSIRRVRPADEGASAAQAAAQDTVSRSCGSRNERKAKAPVAPSVRYQRVLFLIGREDPNGAALRAAPSVARRKTPSRLRRRDGMAQLATAPPPAGA